MANKDSDYLDKLIRKLSGEVRERKVKEKRAKRKAPKDKITIYGILYRGQR